jgi:DNA ligase 1
VSLFADVVTASAAVAETPARSRKVAILAELLRALERAEVAPSVGFLSGVPRQGRVGIGYARVYGTDVPAAAGATLTIADIDHAIDEIEAATGPGSQARRRELLNALFARATSAEADFLRRLLTGELRQGALAGLMADAVAKAAGVPAAIARRALMLSGDLPHTAEIAMGGGEEALRAIGFELFRPILPMLASPAATVADAVTSFDCASVEWKLDGIRIQIHRRGEEVRIYTRNLNDIMASLPGIATVIARLPVTQTVLDGEALWMGPDGPAAFQETVSLIDSDAPPEGVVTFLFDILHLDGEDLLDRPLRERADALAAIAPELQIPRTLTSDPDVAEQVLADALEAGHEGVVIKDAASLYAAGRRGKAWRKVKPVETFDLVVLGAEWGHGRRRGWLSNLHLGARDPDTGDFIMVGKTFKGLTDELLEWQTAEFLARESARHGIVVEVRRELVVEIALDGVQTSTRYPGGIALRFARVKRYRPDKDPAEADTIDALRALLRTGRARVSPVDE